MDGKNNQEMVRTISVSSSVTPKPVKVKRVQFEDDLPHS
jgi:hypothetical protein